MMLKVNLVGIGPGDPKLLTQAAAEAIARSNVLLGDSRMLSSYAKDGKKCVYTIKPAEIKEILKGLDAEKDEAAVLVSGDIGFYSLAKGLDDLDAFYSLERYSGISSLVYFAARLKMSWEDAFLVSLHGRTGNLPGAVATHKKVFALTGGEQSPQALCHKLVACGLGEVQIFVGENLSYPEEKLTAGKAHEIAEGDFAPLSVMMLINTQAVQPLPQVAGLPDESFERAAVPMTKQEVRAVTLAKLGPGPYDTVYDIGAGTGSVTVELARLAAHGQVWAFERNPQAIELIKKNTARFGLDNVTIVEGDAAQVLSEAAVPDCVFIGGSGGELPEILRIIYLKNPWARIVFNIIALETLTAILSYYNRKDEFVLDIVQLQAARAKRLGAYNLMQGQNPVYIITVQRKES